MFYAQSTSAVISGRVSVKRKQKQQQNNYKNQLYCEHFALRAYDARALEKDIVISKKKGRLKWWREERGGRRRRKEEKAWWGRVGGREEGEDDQQESRLFDPGEPSSASRDCGNLHRRDSFLLTTSSGESDRREERKMEAGRLSLPTRLTLSPVAPSSQCHQLPKDAADQAMEMGKVGGGG